MLKMQLPSHLFGAALFIRAAITASLEPVPDYGGTVPMNVYIPDNVTENPALVVVVHSCGSSAENYFQNPAVPWAKGSDGKGYITIWPSSPNSGGCWDVSSQQSLTRDGGGDSTAISQMIAYALTTYSADPEKVFVTGGSSGAMMSNVLAATYPDLIKAVSLYSGVPAGCFASSSGAVAAWNNTCSAGQSIATPEQWANVVKDMYPGYDGPRPKMQIWHGSVDQTLAPPNYDETIKQWTGVFGVGQEPTNVLENTPEQSYTTSDYGENVQGIYAEGTGHSVLPHLESSELWFGL